MLTLANLTAAKPPMLSVPNAAPESLWFGGLPIALPEASSLALLIVGLAVVGVVVRRRQARLAADADHAHDDETGIPGQAGQL
jgi:hypothetical protein